MLRGRSGHRPVIVSSLHVVILNPQCRKSFNSKCPLQHAACSINKQKLVELRSLYYIFKQVLSICCTMLITENAKKMLYTVPKIYCLMTRLCYADDLFFCLLCKPKILGYRYILCWFVLKNELVMWPILASMLVSTLGRVSKKRENFLLFSHSLREGEELTINWAPMIYSSHSPQRFLLRIQPRSTHTLGNSKASCFLTRPSKKTY